jgi:glyoxylase-like metal-dependent hydrolase (beta-lactamase superfamily II)
MPRFEPVATDIFRWSDTCNSYVIRRGDRAVLIDLGDGSVLDGLGEIGVRQVDWVLFTHHHREQCQGAHRLAGRGIRTACSAGERSFFESPASFRKMRPTLNDPHTVYGASYVRPPILPLKIDRTFARMDDFRWEGVEVVCVHTGGNSPGHISYILRDGDHWVAFSGDVMLDGATMHTWFDTEWDYGFAKGLYELGNSAGLLAGYDPLTLLPSHGPVIADGRNQLNNYIEKLRRLGELYGRGYDIQRFAGCDQDRVSRPTVVPHVWQVSAHLFKFRGPGYWPNLHLILSDNGQALLVDCGLFDVAFLDTAIARMKERLGLKTIDAVFVTHMHGDHALNAEHIRKKYGAQLWTMLGVADKFERPWDHDLAALLPMYSKEHGPLKFDRVIEDGALITWQNYTFAVDWMPGQTPYHACLHGEIDGKRVAFTGDNLCGVSSDPRQGGNEAVVARNGGALEDGYLYAAQFLHGIAPDLILGGHCWAIAEPAALIDRLRLRSEALRAAFAALSAEDDYRYGFDPYWVRAKPYRVVVMAGGDAPFEVLLRNFRDLPQTYRVRIRTPSGIQAEPTVLERRLETQGIVSVPVRLKASAETKAGLHLVSLDITRDGKRHGELFDFIVWIGPEPANETAAGTTSGY